MEQTTTETKRRSVREINNMLNIVNFLTGIKKEDGRKESVSRKNERLSEKKIMFARMFSEHMARIEKYNILRGKLLATEKKLGIRNELALNGAGNKKIAYVAEE